MLPFAWVRAAIYVQYFTSGERGVRQEQHCIYDFFDFTHPSDRVQPFEKLMGLGFMHRSIDGARRDGVYTNAILGILNCQCALFFVCLPFLSSFYARDSKSIRKFESPARA